MAKSTRQPVSVTDPSGQRVLEALNSREDIPKGREVKWLVDATGLADSTVRDAIRRGPSRADVAVKIARALGIDLEWMLTGKTVSRGTLQGKLHETDELVSLPRYALGDFSGPEKPEPVGEMPVYSAMLDRVLQHHVGLWVSEMPGSALSDISEAGDTIVLRDPDPRSDPIDGGVYALLIDGRPIVRRILIEPGRIVLSSSDRYGARFDVKTEEIGRSVVVLGRVVGAFSLHKV